MKDSFNTSLPSLKLRTFLVCLWWRRRERGFIFVCVTMWVWYFMSHRLLKLWDNYNHVSLPCVVKCSFYPVLVLPQMIRDKKSKWQKMCLNDSWLWALTLFNLYLYFVSLIWIFNKSLQYMCLLIFISLIFWVFVKHLLLSCSKSYHFLIQVLYSKIS